MGDTLEAKNLNSFLKELNPTGKGGKNGVEVASPDSVLSPQLQKSGFKIWGSKRQIRKDNRIIKGQFSLFFSYKHIL